MKQLGKSLLMTISFFTTIPMVYIEWDEKSNKYMPLFIPLIGIIIGGGFYLVLYVLNLVEISSFLSTALIVTYFVLITGGLHMDAFMDTSDAHFSRRDIEKKLVIMKDSNIGAFAALYLVILLLMKVALYNEVFLHEVPIHILIVIPFLSRFFQTVLLLNTPFAKDDGLAKMYGSLSGRFQLSLFVYVLLYIGYSMLFLSLYESIGLVCVAFLYFLIYRRFSLKQFGGITGDIVGAYIEIVEVLLVGGVVLYGMLLWW